MTEEYFQIYSTYSRMIVLGSIPHLKSGDGILQVEAVQRRGPAQHQNLEVASVLAVRT